MINVIYPKLMFATWVLVLVACTTNDRLLMINGIDLLSQSKLAEMQIETGQVFDSLVTGDLSTEAEDKVLAAVSQYRLSKEVLKAVTHDPITLVNAVGVLRTEHARLTSAYTQLQAVVAEHWDTYPVIEQLRLATWQQEVFRLETAYNHFMDEVSNNTAQVMKNAAVVDMIMTLTKIAVAVA